MNNQDKVTDIIKKVLRTRTSVIIPYEDFPRVALNTLYQYIYRALNKENAVGKIGRKSFADGIELYPRDVGQSLRNDSKFRFFQNRQFTAPIMKIESGEMVTYTPDYENCPKYFEELQAGLYRKIVVLKIGIPEITVLFEPPPTIKLSAVPEGTLIELITPTNQAPGTLPGS